MKTSAAPFVAAVFLSSISFARDLPNYDAFLEDGSNRPVRESFSNPRTERLVESGHIAHVEQRLGVPTFFWAAHDSTAPDLRAMGVRPIQAARRYLFDYAELYGFAPLELAEVPVEMVHDTGFAPVIVTFRLDFDGLPLFRDEIKVAMDAKLQLVAISGYLNPHAAVGSKADKLPFHLDYRTAIAVAFGDLTGLVLEPGELVEEGRPVAHWRYFRQTRPSPLPFGIPARIRKVVFGLPDGLEPAYHLELDVASPASLSSDYYAYVISARDGRLLFRKNLTEDAAYTYRVWAEPSGKFTPFDGPQGTSASPHPTGTPDGYQAPFVPPLLVTLQNGPISTNDPWLPNGATETTGNNVEAYADIVGPDGFTADCGVDGGFDLRAIVNAADTFDRTYDPTQSPDVSTDQRQAAITQLFFDINWLHDWFYDRGFDETSRNAQASNYGRGGLENDSIRGEAQDYSGRNNADMATPSDGARPRMQQYVWTGNSEQHLTVTAPQAVAGLYRVGVASFGPSSFALDAGLVLAVDVALLPDGGVSSLGCPDSDGGTLAYANAAQIAGNIALVDRGSCSFVFKALNAQSNGAVGIVIANNVSGAGPMGMSDTDPNVTIPVLSVGTADGAALKAALANAAGQAVMFRAPEPPDRDSAIDNTIVAHEWGHYISNRLVGNSVGLVNSQGRGMGEGWADFHALLMMIQDSDRNLPQGAGFSGVYAAAAYVASGGGATNQGYFFGIRRVGYSTDMAKNALMFRHISNGSPLPTTAPIEPNGLPNAEVHNTGEIWATMLLELYARLLNDSRYTFDQAQDRMSRYLVAAYKLTPNSPTMLEARDALLAAAFAADPAGDFLSFAQAFAKRGAGAHAVSPDRASTTNSPVRESFTTGGEVAIAGITLIDDVDSCDNDGALDGDETGTLSITVKNIGSAPLSQITGLVTSQSWFVAFPNGQSLSFPALQPHGTATSTLPVKLSAMPDVMAADFRVQVTEPQRPIGPAVRNASFRVHWTALPNGSTVDDAEAPSTVWTMSRDIGLPATRLWTRRELSATSHVYHGPNTQAPGDAYLVSPPLTVSSTGNFAVSFRHRYDFEFDQSQSYCYDAGVIEISTDNGNTWNDVGQTLARYNGTVYTPPSGPPSSNPLRGRAAFCGRSTGYPAFIQESIDFGTAYAGQTVLLRFRVGSDDLSFGVGWEIDDISFTGITNAPFPQVVADRCANRPVARPGTDFSANERTAVTLDGSASSDPNGDVLSFFWRQAFGPQVVLNGQYAARASFEAPEVTGATPLGIELRVSDGKWWSNPAGITITVQHVNRPPIADAGPPRTVPERTTGVQLRGSAVDPDGDAVTGYRWTQTGGPVVTLQGASTAQPTFDAPEVPASGAVLTFALTATDGTDTGPAATTIVTIENVNRPPVADAGENFTVDERTVATLRGFGTDADGESLTFRWKQVAGPPVQLTNADQPVATFKAPEVTEDKGLLFELTAHDGIEPSDPARVTVIIRHVNRKPVADAGPNRTVSAGSRVRLYGSSTDPDGDGLTYEWRQVSGHTVVLENPYAERATFVAPEVTERAVLGFELVVSDGQLFSDPARVEVVVTPNLSQPRGCGCQLGGFGPLAMLAVLAFGLRSGRGGSFRRPD